MQKAGSVGQHDAYLFLVNDKEDATAEDYFQKGTLSSVNGYLKTALEEYKLTPKMKEVVFKRLELIATYLKTKQEQEAAAQSGWMGYAYSFFASHSTPTEEIQQFEKYKTIFQTQFPHCTYAVSDAFSLREASIRTDAIRKKEKSLEIQKELLRLFAAKVQGAKSESLASLQELQEADVFTQDLTRSIEKLEAKAKPKAEEKKVVPTSLLEEFPDIEQLFQSTSSLTKLIQGCQQLQTQDSYKKVGYKQKLREALYRRICQEVEKQKRGFAYVKSWVNGVFWYFTTGWQGSIVEASLLVQKIDQELGSDIKFNAVGASNTVEWKNCPYVTDAALQEYLDDHHCDKITTWKFPGCCRMTDDGVYAVLQSLATRGQFTLSVIYPSGGTECQIKPEEILEQEDDA